MHEFSLADHLLSLLEQAAQEQGFTRVHRLMLGIGRFSCVDIATLVECIQAQSMGTLMEGADLDCHLREGHAECTLCDATFAPEEWPCVCPQCGKVASRLLDGRDLVLETMEVS
jgi:hydrogenase nickel incorporation protein HypA/HybF